MYLTKKMNSEETALHIAHLFQMIKSAESNLAKWRAQDLPTLEYMAIKDIRSYKRELVAYGGLTWRDLP